MTKGELTEIFLLGNALKFGASDTIVPLVGARNVVSANATCAATAGSFSHVLLRLSHSRQIAPESGDMAAE